MVWDRPKNLFNITGYNGPGQAAGGKILLHSWSNPARINQLKYMRQIVFLALPFLFLFIFHVVILLLILLLHFLILLLLSVLHLLLFLRFFLYSFSSSSVVSLTYSFTSLWIHCFKTEFSFSQSLWCISRIILTVISLQSSISQNNSYKQHHTMDFKQKPESLVHLSKISICQWTYQFPSEWKVLESLFTNKIVKMLSHVVNITVHILM